MVQQLANRIESRLSKKPETAGSPYMSYESAPVQPQTTDAMYTFGQNCGGAARNYKKQFGNNGLIVAHVNWRAGRQQTKSKRISPSWMRGVKGCSVRVQDHLERNRNSSDEITVANEKLKLRYPTVLPTVEKFPAI